MTVRLLVDEDVDPDIVKGLRLRAPDIDIRDVKREGLRGTRDEVLLELAYAEGRVLVSYDKHTMTRYFHERLAAGRDSAGVFCPVEEGRDRRNYRCPATDLRRFVG